MTLRVRFYIALFSSFVAIGAHLIANDLYLYWTYKQIDIPIHVLGGIMSGLYVLVALRYFKLPEILKNVAIGVFIIGVAWEVLEIIYKAVDYGWYYYFDTVKDLIDDVVGAVISLYIWKRLPGEKVSGEVPNIK